MGINIRLREVREDLHLTQEQFGELCGVKPLTQHNYEKGERKPDAHYLAKAAAMGADVLYILTGMRNDNVARGSVELSVLQRFRTLDTKERYAVVKLLAALVGQDAPPAGWERF